MKLKVLWITKGMGLGGAERLLSMLPSYFDPDQFEIDIVYVLPWKDALEADARRAGANVYCLGHGRGGHRLWPFRLARFVRRRRYDIIHTHSPLPGSVARMVAPRSTVFLHTEHSAWPRYRVPTRAANSLTYRRNSIVLAVSNGVAASIRRDPGCPVEVVYHGIDAQAVQHGPAARIAARIDLGIAEGTPLIGTVGSLSPKKDQRTLLSAFAQLRSSVPDVQLVIVGGGPLEADLSRQARHLGIESAVRFLGVRHDVQRLLPAFDVFVLTSVYEALGLVLIEAMAAGIPCVATAVDGVPEVISDGVEGVLVAPRNPRALSSALAELLGDGNRCRDLGENGQVKSRAFSVKHSAERMADLYREVAGKAETQAHRRAVTRSQTVG